MMNWLSGIVGESAAHIISFIGLFAFFLLVIFVIYAVIKRATSGTYVSKPVDSAPRLTVTDAAAVDGQRRLVLVRRDDVEHLILIGGPSDIVIEQNITRHKPAPHDTRNQPSGQFTNHASNQRSDRNTSAPVQQQHRSEQPPVEQEPASPMTQTAYRPATEAVAAPMQSVVQPVAQPVAQSAPHSGTQQAQPQPAHSLPLQTHAQQVAAARQQQIAAKPAPQPARALEQPATLHPVYPLGQVSRGVVAATSGLAAASNAAQQELIAAAKRAAPSLDDVRPGSSSQPVAPMPRATPQLTRSDAQEPSFSPSFGNAPAASKNAGFELDLENAVAEALSGTPEMSFEDLLSSEMEQHFIQNDKQASLRHEPSANPTGHDPKPVGGTLHISPRK